MIQTAKSSNWERGGGIEKRVLMD